MEDGVRVATAFNIASVETGGAESWTAALYNRCRSCSSTPGGASILNQEFATCQGDDYGTGVGG
jgi:hypothetical protein